MRNVSDPIWVGIVPLNWLDSKFLISFRLVLFNFAFKNYNIDNWLMLEIVSGIGPYNEFLSRFLNIRIQWNFFEKFKGKVQLS